MEDVVLPNGWSFRHHKESCIIPMHSQNEALALLSKWAEVYPREETWVQRMYGVPSLFARIDGVVSPEGRLVVFEVDDRPAGIGVSCAINPLFKEAFERTREHWPHFYSVMSDTRITDDELWTKTKPLEKALANGSLVLVRARPEESAFKVLAPRSVSTVASEGRKSYGEKLGLWKRISNPETLPWESGFVLKPDGTRGRDVMIWPTAEDRARLTSRQRRALPTRSQIEKKANAYCASEKPLYLQPYHSPMRTKDGLPMIYRFYFAYDPIEKRWVALGGVYHVMHDCALLVHGTNQAGFGPLEAI